MRKNDASERVEPQRSNAGKYSAKASVNRLTRRTASAQEAALSYPKDPAVLKILRVVNLLRVVNCDLLVLTPFPGNYRHFSSQRRVHGIVNMGGVVKTLRCRNSHFLLSS